VTEKKAKVRNAADPEQVRKAKETDTFTRDDELGDLRTVLGTLAGRRLLWRVLGFAGYQRLSFSSDALVMARNEGGRNVALWLQTEIEEADTDAFLTMIREANKIEANKVEPESPPND
jgi:hypothetical protein